MSDHEIILGDCLEGMRGMEAGSVAHVLCDPPYSERVHKGKGAERRHDGGFVEALDFEHLTARMRYVLALEWARLARRWIVVFCDEESVYLWKRALEAADCEWACKGTWFKEGASPRMDGTRPAYWTEAIGLAHAPRTSGKTRWNAGGKGMTYSASIQEPDRFHPTQKPLKLMEAIVRDFTDPGELILDPFAGSGTTGVACKRLGRKFIGFERDPKFHAAAVKRLENTREQYELIPRLPKPKQARLLP